MTASDNNIRNETVCDPVQQRLLGAGEELFCRKGYKGTSIRDLTTLAECNIAAVNYYFGGKKKLYKEVFRRQLDILRDVRIAGINRVMAQQGENLTLESLLRAFAEAFIEPLVVADSGRSFIKLMMHEMLDPHLPANMFLDETVIPVVESLRDALKKVCPHLTDDSAVYCIRSIIAQLLHAIQLQELFKPPDATYLGIDLKKSVEHIIAFSAAGIRHYAMEAD
ncbi:MAG: TetR/AcrR family transcriptional regulator [Planctomycetota bacterium]|jgi:AcrR family transcriptional regulator